MSDPDTIMETFCNELKALRNVKKVKFTKHHTPRGKGETLEVTFRYKPREYEILSPADILKWREHRVTSPGLNPILRALENSGRKFLKTGDSNAIVGFGPAFKPHLTLLTETSGFFNSSELRQFHALVSAVHRRLPQTRKEAIKRRLLLM